MFANQPINSAVFPETAALAAWVESERSKGLVDIKFFKRDTNSSTVESFCAEVNEMLRAPEIPDSDSF